MDINNIVEIYTVLEEYKNVKNNCTNIDRLIKAGENGVHVRIKPVDESVNNILNQMWVDVPQKHIKEILSYIEKLLAQDLKELEEKFKDL